MRSSRWLAGVAATAVVGSSLMVNAAVASASPDDTYLARLRTLGFTWPPDHDAALTAMGRLICDDIAWGWTYDQIAQSIHANLDPRNVSLGDVTSMVSLAHSTYCPNQRCWMDHC